MDPTTRCRTRLGCVIGGLGHKRSLALREYALGLESRQGDVVAGA